jgi:putative transposase
MPRRLTPFLSDHFYHIYNRGNNRQVVFFEGANYLYFLAGIRKYLLRSASIVAYCLMPTHYHLLVRVRDPDQNSEASNAAVSKAMMRLSVSYTKAINKRFDRVGSLFQGPFQAKLIKTYSHLLNLCIYIHANPVKDRLVDSADDWRYSNYLDWLGERDGRLIDREFVQEHFGSPGEYRILVNHYLRTRKIAPEVRGYLHMLEDEGKDLGGLIGH